MPAHSYRAAEITSSRLRLLTPPEGNHIRPHRRALAWLLAHRAAFARSAGYIAVIVLVASVVGLGAKYWRLRDWVDRHYPAATADVVLDRSTANLPASRAPHE